MPRLPAKTANEHVGVPEWDASIERIQDLIGSIRRRRAEFNEVLGETRVELTRLSRRVTSAGREYGELALALYRLGQDLDSSDVRTTSLMQEIGELDQKYRRLADTPFGRAASDDLAVAWGRTLDR